MSGADGTATALTGLGCGMQRAATALLASLTNESITLRMPQPPMGDSDAEELGLGSPQFNDVVLAPALVQQRGGKVLVTIAAEALEAALGVSGACAVEQAVGAASFALVGDCTLQVAQVQPRALGGRAITYRLVLVSPESA